MPGKKEHISRALSEAEIALLKEGLNRTYKERFEMATRLYKVQPDHFLQATFVGKRNDFLFSLLSFFQ